MRLVKLNGCWLVATGVTVSGWLVATYSWFITTLVYDRAVSTLVATVSSTAYWLILSLLTGILALVLYVLLIFVHERPPFDLIDPAFILAQEKQICCGFG